MLICFGQKPSKDCESYDGQSVKDANSTTESHNYGALALYNGQPAAIGGADAKGTVEILTDEWKVGQTHPRYPGSD